MPIGKPATKLMYVGPERFWEHDRVLVEALERRGHEVAVSHDQAKALLRLEHMAEPPQLIVLIDYDYRWDGVPLVTLIRESSRHPQIPVVMLSTNCDPHIPDRRPRAMTAGATAFLDGVFKVDDLFELITALTAVWSRGGT